MGVDKNIISDLFSNSMSNDEEKDKLESKNSSVTFDHIFNDNIFENNENKESTEDINFDLEEKSLEKNNDNLEILDKLDDSKENLAPMQDITVDFSPEMNPFVIDEKAENEAFLNWESALSDLTGGRSE